MRFCTKSHAFRVCVPTLHVYNALLIPKRTEACSVHNHSSLTVVTYQPDFDFSERPVLDEYFLDISVQDKT